MQKNSTTTEKKKGATPQQPKEPETTSDYELLVFCHLRWGFVYQRPQHLISRLSASLKTLFVEEPIGFASAEEGTYELEVITSQLHVLKPRARDTAGIIEILKKLLPSTRLEVGWFYSAAFSEVLSEFSFNKLVYDCMDELSLFKGAAPELVRQEKFLLSEADVVFTGGKSLYDAKRESHENVHCFPSSVERAHFSRASRVKELPGDIGQLAKPVAGYFGVIDERLDLELLQQVAVLRPSVNFVMLGPLAKIGEEDLPREKNIHYLGMKSYKELPEYLAAFDVAMMPFALNDATRFISPTKTLEYMAAGKPIISTAIKDVERDYKHCIDIVSTAEEFAAALDRLLEAAPAGLSEEYEKILDQTSWDLTAARMKSLILSTTKA